MLPGATPQDSVENLYNWLDTVIVTAGFSHTQAMSSTGGRVKGAFHHLSREELNKINEILDIRTRQWQVECIQNRLSAGMKVEISGGSGSGRGLLTMSVVGLGPFQS